MIKGIDYPEWMQEEGLQTLIRGYLLPNETPKDMYWRVAKAAANYLKDSELSLNYEAKFFEYMWAGWLCPASPILSNMGTERGLPISCYCLDTPDTMEGIGQTNLELMMLTKYGGGVGISVNKVRGRNTPIKGNGFSEGVVPWCKIYDSTIIASNQGSTRKGAASVNINIEHLDIEEFIRIRRPSGDSNRQCLNLHHCVLVTDNFMNKVESGEAKARELWKEILKTRLETGEPYIMFVDSVNKANPQAYINNNLTVSTTNICSEILLHTSELYAVVCCLSSLNWAKYDQWKNTNLAEIATIFLDCIMEEFLTKSKDLPGFARAYAGAVKGRPIGIGALGWHSLLQSKMLPFDNSMEVMALQAEILKNIDKGSKNASKWLAELCGEPEWCKGTGYRNTHRMAIAPTVSNAKISGGFSPSIEPIAANAYSDATAKGVFTYKNPELIKLLTTKNKNDIDTWKSIVQNEGSVQHLDFLTELEKEVFLTAREINQMIIIRQAAQRYQWIDQAQSLNLFFPVNVDPKWFHKIHMEAWKLGIKTLYYCRSSSILKGDVASRFYNEDCKACEA